MIDFFPSISFMASLQETNFNCQINWKVVARWLCQLTVVSAEIQRKKNNKVEAVLLYVPNLSLSCVNNASIHKEKKCRELVISLCRVQLTLYCWVLDNVGCLRFQAYITFHLFRKSKGSYLSLLLPASTLMQCPVRWSPVLTLLVSYKSASGRVKKGPTYFILQSTKQKFLSSHILELLTSFKEEVVLFWISVTVMPDGSSRHHSRHLG